MLGEGKGKKEDRNREGPRDKRGRWKELEEEMRGKYLCSTCSSFGVDPHRCTHDERGHQ